MLDSMEMDGDGSAPHPDEDSTGFGWKRLGQGSRVVGNYVNILSMLGAALGVLNIIIIIIVAVTLNNTPQNHDIPRKFVVI